MWMEVVIGVLVLALGLATLAAAYIGALGLLGVCCVIRCAQCGRLGVTAADRPVRQSCRHCSGHQRLHPFVTVREHWHWHPAR
jgi:hypothetical protein